MQKTKEEILKKIEIRNAKSRLAKLDIKRNKFIDGEITEDEWTAYREEIKYLREKIRSLEEEKQNDEN